MAAVDDSIGVARHFSSDRAFSFLQPFFSSANVEKITIPLFFCFVLFNTNHLFGAGKASALIIADDAKELKRRREYISSRFIAANDVVRHD